MSEPTFQEELTRLINKHNLENSSGTPDYILAGYLVKQLELFDLVVNARADWRNEDVEMKAPSPLASLEPEFPEELFEPVEMDFGFHKDLEQCVAEAFGAVSACWTNTKGAGIFLSTRAAQIHNQLMKRINDSGPIYG